MEQSSMHTKRPKPMLFMNPSLTWKTSELSKLKWVWARTWVESFGLARPRCDLGEPHKCEGDWITKSPYIWPMPANPYTAYDSRCRWPAGGPVRKPNKQAQTGPVWKRPKTQAFIFQTNPQAGLGLGQITWGTVNLGAGLAQCRYCLSRPDPTRPVLYI